MKQEIEDYCRFLCDLNTAFRSADGLRTVKAPDGRLLVDLTTSEIVELTQKLKDLRLI